MSGNTKANLILVGNHKLILWGRPIFVSLSISETGPSLGKFTFVFWITGSFFNGENKSLSAALFLQKR